LQKTNPAKGQTLAALIFNAYQEYQQNHYPGDPKIYVIRVHPATEAKIITYLSSSFKFHPNDDYTYETPWGFQLKTDLRLEEDTVVFGPETVEFKWEGE